MAIYFDVLSTAEGVWQEEIVCLYELTLKCFLGVVVD